MSRFGNYLRDTAAEMKHVKWPTQSQTIVYTILVVVVSTLVALYLSMFDYAFSQALNSIIK
jgi:preprotein translocase SecE subunit